MAERKSVKEQLGVDIEEPVEVEVTPVAEPEPAPEPAPDRPEWLPSQYKTPEDFAQAHKSAQDKIREQGETLREQGQQLELLSQQQQPRTEPTDVLTAVADEIEQAREAGDVHREVQLQAWLQQQTVQQAFQGFQQAAQQQTGQQQEIQASLYAETMDGAMTRQIDDWPDYRERVAETLEAYPGLLTPEDSLSTERTQKGLKAAYDLVKAQDVLSQQEQLREKGLSQADLGRARKLQSQTMTGASGRPDQPSQADQDLAEMQQALHGNSYASFRNK